MTTPTIEVPLSEIDRIHDAIMDVIESLDSVGNGDGDPSQVLSDCIYALTHVVQSEMFDAAAEAYNGNLGELWPDDDETFITDDLTSTEIEQHG